MSTVLITGINGFVGQHLARELVTQGHQVDGLAHEGNLASALGGVVSNYHVVDIADETAINKLDLSAYDIIFNIAGMSSMGKSFTDPKRYMEVNADAVGYICKRMSAEGHKGRLLAISSGVVYDPNQALPFTEASVVALGKSPYTVSKLQMEQTVLSYIDKGLDCVIARPFNHIGPGQQAGFLVQDLCQQLLQVAGGAKDFITAGNLASKRDYSDVHDVVKAYILLAFADGQSLTSTTYNVCSGVSHSGQSILEELQKNIPGTEQVRVELNPAFLRPGDPAEIRGSHELISRDTGWQPQIPFEKTITSIVESVKEIQSAV